MQHQSRQSRPSSSADRSSLPRPSGERTSRRSEDYSTPRSATRPSAERSSAKDRSPRPPATNRSSVDRHHVDRSRAPYQSSEEREARPRRRTSTERHDTKQRSASLPAEAHMLQEDFPEGGRESRIQKRRQSAPAGDMIPLIQSALRVTTQYLSINTKGLTQDLTQHKRVEFAFLEVREYPVVLGDNPSVLEGPPITIDWAHDPSTEFVLDINTFERMRGNRRTSAELVLPRHVRERWLLNAGTTQKEIAEAVRQCRREKHFRAVSCNNKGYDPMNESIEKVASGLKKMFSFKKTEYEKALAIQTPLDMGRPKHAVTA